MINERIQNYINEYAFCSEYLFKDWESFVDLLYAEGGRISSILWWDHCRKAQLHESVGSGGYRDPENDEYIYAETQLYKEDLPDTEKALHELERVVKPGGEIIIPTYINKSKGTGTAAVKFITLLGADFKRQFDLDSYKQFFEDKGYTGVEYHVVDGRMPCAIAVITKA